MELVTQKELSDRYKIPRSTVWDLRDRGEWVEGIHFFKLGRSLRFNERLIQHWLKHGRTNPQLHAAYCERFLAVS